MDRPTTGDALPEFARALATQIERRMEGLHEKYPNPERLPPQIDAAIFTEFESLLTLALENYRPEAPRAKGIGRLVFQPLYDDALVSKPAAGAGTRPAAGRPALLSALMAAQVEALGPLRLTRIQTGALAKVLFDLGTVLDTAGLLRHAAAAFDRAARLYAELDDEPARDRCLKKLAAVRHHALPRGWRRGVQQVNALMFGYGFEPFRFLAWMGAQLALACVILVLLPRNGDPHRSITATLYLAVQDYVNPMGLGDTEGYSHWAWMVLAVESYMGWISGSVFFALLLRKWFRM